MEQNPKFNGWDKPGLMDDLAKKAAPGTAQSPVLDKLMDAMAKPEEFARQRNAQAAMSAPYGQSIDSLSRNALIRLAKEQQDQLNRMDILALAAEAKRGRYHFQHKEAFMLMKYVSEGGTDVKLIWNSRDGVTPFQVHIDGMKYTHSILEMQGPFFDRPEGIVGQWETRTEMEMMLAWRRVLNKALLLGRMTEEKVIELQNSPDAARGNWLQIGLRSMATGRYTDEDIKA